MGAPLAPLIAVPQVLADRFIASGRWWVDLATGAFVRVRLLPAGSSREQLDWSARCALSANLRHPAINPLIDYGAADRYRLFEAYAARGPIRAGGAAGERMLASAVRFLEASGVALARPTADFMLRSIEDGPVQRLRPIGVILQRRRVYDTIADALDAAGPGGACAVRISGGWQTGLRTARTIAARTARLKGYVPVHPSVLRQYAWLLEFTKHRHICVVEGEEDEKAAVTSLLTTLGAESARRHVWLEFRRASATEQPPAVQIDPMGVIAMSGMIFVDPEYGPGADEVLAAARTAEGKPGRCLASLRAYETGLVRTGAMVVHETPVSYEARRKGSMPSRPRAAGSRAAGVLDRAIERGEALARGGRHASADRILSRAARVLLGRERREDGARAILMLGWHALERGRTEAATSAFERARAASGSPRSTVIATIGLGIARMDDGELGRAEGTLRSALVAARGVNERELLLSAAAALGRCLFWQGRIDEAFDLLTDQGDVPRGACAARILVVRARVQLARGLIPAAVRSARTALEMATSAADPCVRASAFRTLAAAVASAGDPESAARHVADGIRVAAAAHLPLAVLRLRLTLADIQGSGGRPQDRRLVSRCAAAAPRLLRSFGRAVFARLEGKPLDPDTQAFVVSSGAVMIERPSVVAAINPLVDLEALVELAHSAGDDRAAVERVASNLQSRLRAATVLVLTGSPERRVVGACGRPWSGEPEVGWRAADTGVGFPLDPSVQPLCAAEPVRYGGDVIGAITARWTAGTTIDAARAASLLRIGALALAASVRALLDCAALPPAVPAATDLLGESLSARALKETVARAARAPFPVLIQGESGSGKELVARAIHRLGPRRDRRFCALNCAALSDELIEAELFGHARGAFTGAIGERAGLFEEADGGTLFLDEIGELSARAQAKLLRVLQDGEVRRVGENVSRRVDVRIVAATNRRLEQEAEAGRFRPDLRFRLDVIRIEVPPLRDRPDDVPVLAMRFWSDAASRVGTRATLAPEAVSALARYDWPGNVRELQNVMAWVAVHSPGRGRIGAAALPAHVAQSARPQPTSFETARAEFDRRFIKAALANADGQRARAAAALGVTRQGLAKMMRRLGLDDRGR